MGNDIGGWCCCGATTIIVLGGIATLIAWSVSQAKDPHFFINQTTISNYNLTSNSTLTSTFNIFVSAYNPNPNYFIYYDVLMVSVYDDNSTLLAYEVLPDPFSHHPKTNISLAAGAVAQGVAVAADGSLKAAGSGNGTAGLEVRVRAVTRFRYKGWKKFHHMMKATCSPIAVKFNSSSPPTCKLVAMSTPIDFFVVWFYLV